MRVVGGLLGVEQAELAGAERGAGGHEQVAGAEEVFHGFDGGERLLPALLGGEVVEGVGGLRAAREHAGEGLAQRRGATATTSATRARIASSWSTRMSVPRYTSRSAARSAPPSDRRKGSSTRICERPRSSSSCHCSTERIGWR